MSTEHLSAEQMDALLTNTATEETARHAAECDQCAAELASLREIFMNMRTAATTLATEQYPSAKVVVMPKRTLKPLIAWASAAAAAIALAVALPVMHSKPQQPVVAQQPVAVQPQTAALSDEALLNSIQDDLTNNVPDAMQPLAASDNDTQTTTRKN